MRGSLSKPGSLLLAVLYGSCERLLLVVLYGLYAAGRREGK